MPESLHELVRRVDDLVRTAVPEPEGLPVLFGLTAEGVEVVRPPPELDHPVPMLEAFPVPDDWWAIGVIAAGRARHVDDGAVLGRMRVTYAVSRTGEQVSWLRWEDDGEELALGPLEGRIPDACRRALAHGGPSLG
jgi:hypothetical protein